jgi:hypothetical protein
MATIKNIPDKYTINTPLMTINGNLAVLGSSTIIQSTNTSIYDNIIVLNSGLGANTAPTLNAGITVDRGSSANVQIQWTESLKSWQLTNDGSNYGNVVASVNGTVTLASNIVLKNTAVAPTATAGASTVFAQTVGNGGSGVYVTNSTYTDEELATKKRSIAFSIIFG